MAAEQLTRAQIERRLDECEHVRWWDTGVRAVDDTPSGFELRFLLSLHENEEAVSLTTAGVIGFLTAMDAVERTAREVTV